MLLDRVVRNQRVSAGALHAEKRDAVSAGGQSRVDERQQAPADPRNLRRTKEKHSVRAVEGTRPARRVGQVEPDRGDTLRGVGTPPGDVGRVPGRNRHTARGQLGHDVATSRPTVPVAPIHQDPRHRHQPTLLAPGPSLGPRIGSYPAGDPYTKRATPGRSESVGEMWPSSAGRGRPLRVDPDVVHLGESLITHGPRHGSRTTLGRTVPGRLRHFGSSESQASSTGPAGVGSSNATHHTPTQLRCRGEKFRRPRRPRSGDRRGLAQTDSADLPRSRLGSLSRRKATSPPGAR